MPNPEVEIEPLLASLLCKWPQQCRADYRRLQRGEEPPNPRCLLCGKLLEWYEYYRAKNHAERTACRVVHETCFEEAVPDWLEREARIMEEQRQESLRLSREMNHLNPSSSDEEPQYTQSVCTHEMTIPALIQATIFLLENAQFPDANTKARAEELARSLRIATPKDSLL
jgi:hypothetical protein